jgi:hypothetical protein
LLGQAALHEVFGVVAKLGDFIWRDKSMHHQEPLAPERHVFLDRDLIAGNAPRWCVLGDHVSLPIP